MLRIIKFIIGFTLSVVIASLIGVGMIYVIPIRGTGLTVIIIPVVTLIGIGCLYITGLWVFQGEE